MKHFVSLLSITAIVGMTSCHHKDLYFEDPNLVGLEVVYDWRNAPDADPESMELHLFNHSDNEHLRYNFPNRTGGEITIPYGEYDGISLNNDITDWAEFRNTAGIESYEICTLDATTLSAYGLSAASVPRSRDAEEERVAATPKMLWSVRNNNINIAFPNDGKKQTIVFYPEENVCHYTVDIIDVENISDVSGAEIDGTISGMAEGFRIGGHAASDTHVTMPFTLSIGTDKKSMHSEFLTFGECETTSCKHILTIYMYLNDGTKWYYTFDVTNQVQSAPDPRHVHIVISGLTVPKSFSDEGGFNPSVNDWQTKNIDLEM